MLRIIKTLFGWRQKPAYLYFAKRCYENNYYRWHTEDR